MGGRVLVADLEHQDGTRETRTLTGRTKGWLLPDPAPDEPVPPPGDRREHIMPDRLRVGDTVTAGGSTGCSLASTPKNREDGGYRVLFVIDEGHPDQRV